MRLVLSAIIAAAVVLIGAEAAWAHVAVVPSSTVAGSRALLTFEVPHGCDGSATTEIVIRMPDDVVEATPTRNAFYRVSKQTKRLTEPLTAEDGDEITEKVDTITYRAKVPLPDGYRDAFDIAIDIPEDSAGRRLWFPTIQTCLVGSTAWTQIPVASQDPDLLEHPAPSFVVEAPDDGGSLLQYVVFALGALTVAVGGWLAYRRVRGRS